MSSLAAIPFNKIDGTPSNLGEFAGSVVLAVNVASKFGLTPQYEGLEKLYEDFRDQGLVVLGFPANNFRGQEPGSNDEIVEFCTTTSSSPRSTMVTVNVALMTKPHPAAK